MLILSDKSGKPNLFKIILYVLLVDFVLSILYGIAMEGKAGNMDAQMTMAPVYLSALGVLSFIAVKLFYTDMDKIKTSVAIYENRVEMEALPTKLTEKGKDKKIGEVTNVILPLSQIYAATQSTKNKKSVLIITNDGDRYVLLRMGQAEQIAKVISDKIGK